MIQAIRLDLGRHKGHNWVRWIGVDHKSLKYWTSFELSKLTFFVFAFLVLISPDFLNVLVLFWVFEKIFGYENLKNTRFVQYIDNKMR